MRHFSMVLKTLWLLPLITAVVLAIPSITQAKGPPAGKGGGGGGGSVTTTYSGEATAVDITLNTFLLGETKVVLSDTGQLDASGGMLEKGLSESVQTGLVDLGVSVLSSSVTGSGDLTHANATVVGLELSVMDALTISASVLQANANSQCFSSDVETSGDSHIAQLVINGQDITVTGEPNQTVSIPGVASIIINEQIVSGSSIEVNALHVSLLGDDEPLLGLIDLGLDQLVSADVIISHTKAGISCGDTYVCPVKDFVTGGGQLEVSGGRLSFGMVGGLKPNGLSGHFNAVDHRSGGPHIKAGSVSDYTLVDEVTRSLVYHCTGAAESTCTVTVADRGEPGINDSLEIHSGTYFESGVIARGNIQLHKPGQCDAGSTDGSDDGGGGKGNGKGKKK
ncbi:hypothetical protein MWU49_11725 [Alcanivorax sp. S6407]|uniref:choice-of-anchor P family protein n=1 Tax=Alcanivorax sp. S6407 TaxID=2926424 RepID=UPI001FF23C21|nr:choice-of-anchor P family protein [Alcanivorax sp. S6407]MCK0154375.1 hypothetical protein [Alcanivorax sp. S6407]